MQNKLPVFLDKCKVCIICERVRKMKSDDTVLGSSNFDRLVDYLATDDTMWVEKINAILER